MLPAEHCRDAGTDPPRRGCYDTDGIRIHYVDEGPRHGEAIVMLHGHPAWSYVYRHFIQGLAQSGLRAIAHDQIGFGRSDKPERQEDYTIQRNVEHFGALMDALGGFSPIRVCGPSTSTAQRGLSPSASKKACRSSPESLR